MAFNKKASETGWFYHAPARPALNEPMGVPPPSQIPGLSGVEDGPPPMETPVRNRILETDSKYVQLAKRGGREDLLQFKYLGKPSEQAQSYPRVDWYYLEDIRQEEAEKHRQEEEENSQLFPNLNKQKAYCRSLRNALNGSSRPYEFLLPDYMVHQNYNPTGSPEVDTRFMPKRAIYGYDQTTAFERDARPTDKTVRLPEMKRDGYGIRQEKQKDKTVRHNVPMPVRGKAPQAEFTQERKVQHCVLPEDERPIMSKILSYGYAKDWDGERQKWQATHGNQMQPQTTVYGPTSKDKAQTEYQAQMVQQQQASAAKSRQNGQPRSRENEKRRENRAREEQKEKELFKMNKFKNVPARTVTQRPKNLRPSSPPWAVEVAN